MRIYGPSLLEARVAMGTIPLLPLMPSLPGCLGYVVADGRAGTREILRHRAIWRACRRQESKAPAGGVL